MSGTIAESSLVGAALPLGANSLAGSPVDSALAATGAPGGTGIHVTSGTSAMLGAHTTGGTRTSSMKAGPSLIAVMTTVAQAHTALSIAAGATGATVVAALGVEAWADRSVPRSNADTRQATSTVPGPERQGSASGERVSLPG